MAIDSQQPASRRRVLAAGLGAIGGVAVARLGHPDDTAAVVASVTLGASDASNQTTTLTQVENTTDGAGETSLAGHHAASGIGLSGDSSSGLGVHGASATGTGARAASTDTTPTDFSVPFASLPHSHKTGVIGTAGDTTEIDPNNPSGPGHMPFNTDEVGTFGYANVSSGSTGVWGDSFDGVGVGGSGGTGVLGIGYWGVWAIADGVAGSAALVTDGKISFRGRSGRSYVAANHNYRDVTVTGMTSSSAVIATMQTNRAGVYVQSAVSYAGKFRLYLNKKVTGTTYFSYLVIN